jgi:hypothetical protein
MTLIEESEQIGILVSYLAGFGKLHEADYVAKCGSLMLND